MNDCFVDFLIILFPEVLWKKHMEARNGMKATYILLKFVFLREVSPGAVQLPDFSSTWYRSALNRGAKQDAGFIKGLSWILKMVPREPEEVWL